MLATDAKWVQEVSMEADVAGIAKVLGGREVLGTEVRSLRDLELAVIGGLPKETLRHVARAVYRDAQHQRGLILSIVPEATYKRRRLKLNQAESERTERLARIVAKAKAVWNDGDDAAEFLTAPHPLLEGRSPIEAARSEVGAKRVEHVLGAIEYGLPV
ncbi:antitoxin Xre/MbcA/ParS toxin-binding domain-containing protein [Indioceanicola profundi]|uniref:antitoxin Xre/MbcA/ParS toxin-binding domain-containing protein n=1 Tax=Indioceanicola profundi TaxID=2220096 RepID=UPI001CED5B5B|nr:antitoxin Xre/MbcA/ParS toxin-binding domain-containing protein [Indioceanicola profundi]